MPPTAPQIIPIARATRKLEPIFRLVEIIFPMVQRIRVYLLSQVVQLQTAT